MTTTLAAASRRNRKRVVRALVEALESRTLLTGLVGYAPSAPTATSLAYDGAGQLWVAHWDMGAAEGWLDQVGADGSVVTTVALPGMDPEKLVGAPNGHLYFVDFNSGAISDFDAVGYDPDAPLNIVQHFVDNDQTDYSQVPVQLTVTENGAVWFRTQGGTTENEIGQLLRTSAVGRLDPNGTFSFLKINDIDATIDNAELLSIAARGNDGVALGFRGVDDTNFQGTNRVGVASFNGEITAQLFNVSTGKTADTANYLSSVAVDGDGAIWFNLTVNSLKNRAAAGDELIVKGEVSGSVLIQTAYTLQEVGGAALNTNDLAFDGNGRLWFNQFDGNRVGLFDTVNEQFEAVDLFAGTTRPIELAVNPADGATDVWVTTASDGFSLVNVQIDLAPVTQVSGNGMAVTASEDVSLAGAVVAAFSGPAGTYTATITWEDNTTSPATVVGNPTDGYVVKIGNKVFATQGNHTATVRISLDGVEKLTVASSVTIQDTPLAIGAYTVQPLLGRIVVAALTFTDDIDSSASWFTATINWGDGKTSTGIVVRDPTQAGRYLVLSAHMYRSRGTYSVKATITTTEGNVLASSVSATTTVTV